MDTDFPPPTPVSLACRPRALRLFVRRLSLDAAMLPLRARCRFMHAAERRRDIG